MPGSMEKRNGVGHRSYRRQRDALKRKTKELNLPCWICQGKIDTTLPAGHRDSFEADHVDPLANGGSVHKGELRPSHKRCNATRGSKPEVAKPNVTKLER